ncbi:unnamed protein product [Rotaria sp. Silwood1]|nr:unnamed protein product [Rotaria sp. Silwood1]
MKLNDQQFTGQFISSIILAHIDFHNEINSIGQSEHDLFNCSMSFEFHPDTFRLLFQIIEQLTTLITQTWNSVVVHNLVVCLRLCTTHLEILRSSNPNLDQYFLTKNDEVTETIQSSTTSLSKSHLNLTAFATDDQLQTWFEALLKLVYIDNGKSEQLIICSQASKALLYVVDARTSSFIEKLSFIHKHIMENKHPMFVEQLYKELTKNVVLLNWIETLCKDNDNQTEQITALKILYSFIDSYFKPSDEINNEQQQQLKRILMSFQQLLLGRLVSVSKSKTNRNKDFDDGFPTTAAPNTVSSLVIKYITYILSNYIHKLIIMNDFFNTMLAGLCLMTKTHEIFDFEIIQPIFATTIPLLVEYIFQNTNNDEWEKNNLHCICWLLSKMSIIMIAGSQQNLVERKHIDKLRSSLFAGGCEKIIIENNKYLLNLFKSPLATYSQFKLTDDIEESPFDREFLMSVYNNTNEGAQLISKIKEHMKDRQRFVQKSIEQQVNDAFAAVFAVYIKHYRRINLAKHELAQTDNKRPHHKLLSLYEYANHVQTLFATTKAQGGDCNELYKQIKTNALFLLSSVQSDNSIPIINEDLLQSTTSTHIMTTVEYKIKPSFKRQVSRWTTAKRVLQLLRNTMNACIRFKKLMLAKKQAIRQKLDNESILNRTIDAYIYGDPYKTITSEEKSLESDELIQCMSRQYERAMTRMITYRFIQMFIQKVLSIENQSRALTILSVYLPCLRNTDLEWSYLENIKASTCNLKEKIRNSYYSIIKTILSYILQSITSKPKLLWRNMFNVLNLSYEAVDIEYLYRDQFVYTLFTLFVSFIEKSDYTNDVGFYIKLIGYNWFRLFVLKLSEIIELTEQKGADNKVLNEQQEFVFNTLILNELKGLTRIIPIDTENETTCSLTCKKNSLDNLAIGWFIKRVTTIEDDTSNVSNVLSLKFDIELCINQWLILLLRLVHFYEHVQSVQL